MQSVRINPSQVKVYTALEPAHFEEIDIRRLHCQRKVQETAAITIHELMAQAQIENDQADFVQITREALFLFCGERQIATLLFDKRLSCIAKHYFEHINAQYQECVQGRCDHGKGPSAGKRSMGSTPLERTDLSSPHVTPVGSRGRSYFMKQSPGDELSYNGSRETSNGSGTSSELEGSSASETIDCSPIRHYVVPTPRKILHSLLSDGASAAHPLSQDPYKQRLSNIEERLNNLCSLVEHRSETLLPQEEAKAPMQTTERNTASPTVQSSVCSEDAHQEQQSKSLTPANISSVHVEQRAPSTGEVLFCQDGEKKPQGETAAPSVARTLYFEERDAITVEQQSKSLTPGNMSPLHTARPSDVKRPPSSERLADDDSLHSNSTTDLSVIESHAMASIVEGAAAQPLYNKAISDLVTTPRRQAITSVDRTPGSSGSLFLGAQSVFLPYVQELNRIDDHLLDSDTESSDFLNQKIKRLEQMDTELNNTLTELKTSSTTPSKNARSFQNQIITSPSYTAHFAKLSLEITLLRSRIQRSIARAQTLLLSKRNRPTPLKEEHRLQITLPPSASISPRRSPSPIDPFNTPIRGGDQELT